MPSTRNEAGPHVALIGCGRWGRNILRDLLSLGCSVHVVDGNREAREQASRSGAVSTCTDTSELPGVDGVVVATPTSSHARVARRALALEVPVFVEKPLTDDAASAAQLAQEFAGRLFVMHKWRYHPGVEALARLAAEGALGTVMGLRTVRTQCGYDHGDVDPIWTLAPHDLSIAVAVLGAIPPLRDARAYGMHGQPCGVRAEFGDSPWLSCEISACSNQRQRVVSLVCERGIAVLPEPESRFLDLVEFERDGQRLTPEKRQIPLPGEFPLLRELRAFVAHIGGGAPPLASAEEGAAVVASIAALRARCGLGARS